MFRPTREWVHRRHLVALMVAALTLVTFGWFSAGVAQAAVTSFALSPASGPPGTVVQISGAGCSPGLSLLAGLDFVAVTAPTLDVTMHVPVAANGSWRSTFTVPGQGFGAAPMTAPVAAVCVSGGLDSLTTIYAPQTFAVTTAPPTTTTTPSDPGGTTTPTHGGTTPPSTPPTKAPTGPGGTTSHQPGTSDPGGGAAPGSTNPGSGSLPPAGPSGGSSGSGGSTTGGTTGGSAGGGNAATSGGSGSGHVVALGDAAALRPPELPIAHVSDSGGLGWLLWALLIGLVIAAIAAPFLLRRFRRGVDDPTLIGEAV